MAPCSEFGPGQEPAEGSLPGSFSIWRHWEWRQRRILRLKDLQKLGAAFEIARLERGKGWQGAAAFEAAGNLVNLLRGLRIRLVDRFPQLEGYRRNGPLYGCLDDGQNGSRYHSFSVNWGKAAGAISKRPVLLSEFSRWGPRET